MDNFILNRSTEICCNNSGKPIQYAKRILMRDITSCVTGEMSQNTIRLVRDTGIIAEGYRVRIGINEITVAYSDELGAVYGLLSLSERFLGITPLGFWNSQLITPKNHVEIPVGKYDSPSYAVRFRCWMINDEVLIDGWKDNHEDEIEVWARIFETILRAGGNMVIPGTDRKSDELTFLASDMGLWLTQHHTELLGARMFARVYPDLVPSYQKYPGLFEDLWKEAVDKYAGRKVLWAVGYRGQGDYAFWEIDKSYDNDRKRGELIGRVIRRQMELVRAMIPDARFATNLYGEMMKLYRGGHLTIPDEVIKIWGDNGYGKMVSRRQGNNNPRVPSIPAGDEPGENGLYYHASFYDLQAANHITMSPNDPDMIAGELEQAIQNGADSCWVINVGSIKPHLYILDLIREVWTHGSADVDVHAANYAAKYYRNDGVAGLLTGYSRCTVPYGPNPDDRAGDQYYHFPLRYMAHRLMRGETDSNVHELLWAEGDVPFAKQAEMIGERCGSGAMGWREYLAECKCVSETLDEDAKNLLNETLILQATLHLTGCEGMRDCCRACICLLHDQYVEAYLFIHRALCAHRKGVEALQSAERGEFVGFYRNECFTNVRLTVSVLESVRSWIRVCHDGNNLYDWEKKYLIPPEETRVMCLTHRRNQMSDDNLCEALGRV